MSILSRRPRLTAGVLIAVTLVAVGYSVVSIVADQPREYVAATPAEKFVEAAMTGMDAEMFPDIFLVVDESGERVVVKGKLEHAGDRATLEKYLGSVEPAVPLEWDLFEE